MTVAALCHSAALAEQMQLLVDTFAHRSFHAQVKEKPGHTPLS
jgi:hypothetical protein